MSWLRRDDQRCLNRKIGMLTDVEYRALDALHEFVARSKSRGTFGLADLHLMVYVTPTGPRRVTQRHLNVYVKYRLVDETEDGYEVHDWAEYQPKDPTAADRMQRYRDRNAERNGSVTDDRNESEHDRDSRARVPSRPVLTPPQTPPQGGTSRIRRRSLANEQPPKPIALPDLWTHWCDEVRRHPSNHDKPIDQELQHALRELNHLRTVPHIHGDIDTDAALEEWRQAYHDGHTAAAAHDPADDIPL